MTQLPGDLIQLLALKLSWKDIYEIYIHLPEFRRFDDINHPLWKELYRRDLSTYPLSTGYRDQFFWGHQVVAEVEDTVDLTRLAKLGYDVALEQFYSTKLPYSLPAVAAENGYSTIVERTLDQNLSPAEFVAMSAAKGCHKNLMDYVISRMNREPNYVGILFSALEGGALDLAKEIYHRMGPNPDLEYDYLVKAAVVSENSAVLEWAFSLLPAGTRIDYTLGLRGALEGSRSANDRENNVARQLELAEYMYQHGGQIIAETFIWLRSTTTIETFKWLFERSDAIKVEALVNVARYNTDPNVLKYVLNHYTHVLNRPFDKHSWVRLLDAAVTYHSVKMVDAILSHPESLLETADISKLLFRSSRYISNRADREIFWRLYTLVTPPAVGLLIALCDVKTFSQLLARVRLSDVELLKILRKKLLDDEIRLCELLVDRLSDHPSARLTLASSAEGMTATIQHILRRLDDN